MQNTSLSNQIKLATDKLKHSKEIALSEAIEKLPEPMQLTVNTCFSAGSVTKKQRRYSLEWIFQCTLFRIKSGRAAYEHLRDRDLLATPCNNTIENYIKNLDYDAGFKKVVLETMEFKGRSMQEYEKQGKLR